MGEERGNASELSRGRFDLLASFVWRIPRDAIAHLRAWRDPLGIALAGAAAAANIALFLYLRYTFATLPLVLPLHFTASGEVDRIAPKGEIFKLPYIGLVVLLVNLVLALSLHRHHRPASLILLSAALVVQLIFWWAALNIVF